ncbi:MAG: O-antigen ligase domain-containing protein [Candidatus Zixiibacteriota bacterium]|nr:MAG: O-antigen ligase domain-containing protein [candidate division Zixibacteria bacterium]
MLSRDLTLPARRPKVYLLTLLLALTFFSLIFYLRNTLDDFSLPFIYVFMGIVLISFVSGRLEACLLILLVLTSTIFELMEFPSLPIMIGDLFFSDVLIFLLLAGRLVKRVTQDVVVVPRGLGVPILVFLLVGIFAFFYAVLVEHAPTNTAGVELRSLFHFVLFFLVIYYVRTDRQLRTLALGLGLVACLVAVALAAQYILGSDITIVSGRVELLSNSRGRMGDVTRILVPGSSVIFFTLCSFISMYLLMRLRRRQRLLLLAGICLLTLGLILTFTRIFWVMALAAVVLLMVLTRRRAVIYPRVVLLLAGAVLGLGLILQARVLNPAVIKEAIVSRSASILRAPGNFQHDTLFMRFLESRYAWERIKEKPLLGIGLGKAYRPLIFGKVEYEDTVGGTYLHNGYLATQLKMGLPGTLAFFWVIFRFFRRVFKRWRKIREPLYQALVLGVAASIFGMLLHSLFASPFLTTSWVAVAAVGMGLVEKIYSFEEIA